ncbi:hypothetical protein ACLESO_28255 [Pyxidicoccus sp. 3LG]
MGIHVRNIGFEEAPPPPEVLRATLSERLGSPVKLVEPRTGFGVCVPTSPTHASGFAISCFEQAFELDGRRDDAQFALVCRVLTELGGRAEPIEVMKKGRVGYRVHFDHETPAPERIADLIQRETGIPTFPPQAFETSYELHAPELKPKVRSVSLIYKPRQVTLRASLGRTLLEPVIDALLSLGGRRIPFDAERSP